MKKTRLILVDDHRIFANGLANLLATENSIQIEAIEYTGASALIATDNKLPDILLTDIQMPGMSGIELTRILKEKYPELKIIGLSMFDKPEIIRELIEAGADGYLMKDIEKDELLNAIAEVMNGQTYYSSSVAKVLMKEISIQELLTKREREIIVLISKELSNVQIAEKLFISEHTVESHRKNIFRKTKAKSIVGLINFAHENKLI